MITKHEKLQAIVDKALAQNPELWEFWIEYRHGVGWYALPCESRYFGDEGEFLGKDFNQAKRELKTLLGC